VPENTGAGTSEEAAPEGVLFGRLCCCWFHYVFDIPFTF
jgi:hypothetical protein